MSMNPRYVLVSENKEPLKKKKRSMYVKGTQESTERISKGQSWTNLNKKYIELFTTQTIK